MYLAALHFNENGNKQQAKTKEGKLQWRLNYPKAKKGATAVVKQVKVENTYGNDNTNKIGDNPRHFEISSRLLRI
jgi:hypothetical protein